MFITLKKLTIFNAELKTTDIVNKYTKNNIEKIMIKLLFELISNWGILLIYNQKLYKIKAIYLSVSLKESKKLTVTF